MSLPQLPADKANHFFYGTLVFLAAAALAIAGKDLCQLAVSPRLIGLAASCAAALLKEVADRFANRRAASAGLAAPHEVSIADAVATASGGLVCFIAAAISTHTGVM